MKPVILTDKYVTTLIDEDLWQQLSAIANEKNLDLSYVARELIQQGLQHWTEIQDLVPNHPKPVSQ